MKVTLLGTGTFRPDTEHGSAGMTVQTETTAIQLDMGRGNLMNMARAGIDWKTLQAVYITHVHPDHISDIMQYLQAYTLLYETGEVTTDLQIFGPRDFKAFFDHLRRVIITHWTKIPQVTDLIDETVAVGDMSVTAFPMTHTVEANGYRVEAGGQVLAYTGDTGMNENLVKLAHNADVLITECANTNHIIVEGHLSPKQIAQVATDANVKKVVLTHYPPKEEERQKRAEQVRQAFDGEVIAGQDTLVIEL
ncbi:MAG: MBL fold metallo-hydrolase [Candidatus Kerfeldbacteria bacterium]